VPPNVAGDAPRSSWGNVVAPAGVLAGGFAVAVPVLPYDDGRGGRPAGRRRWLVAVVVVLVVVLVVGVGAALAVRSWSRARVAERATEVQRAVMAQRQAVARTERARERQLEDAGEQRELTPAERSELDKLITRRRIRDEEDIQAAEDERLKRVIREATRDQ
jgi:biopolymer transport protein ExbB/TolQ